MARQWSTACQRAREPHLRILWLLCSYHAELGRGGSDPSGTSKRCKAPRTHGLHLHGVFPILSRPLVCHARASLLWVSQEATRFPRHSLMKHSSSILSANAAALYAIQIANYVFPLATVPYLFRTLGPDQMGKVSFGYGLVAYLTIVVNLGLNLAATRRIARDHDDVNSISRTAMSVWILKLILCAVAFMLLLIFSTWVAKLVEIRYILIMLFGIVLGHTLLPSWLFQGLERMPMLAMIMTGSRFVTVVGVFFLIRGPGHAFIYALLLALQWLIAGLSSALYAIRRFGIRLVQPTWREIKEVATQARLLFVADSSNRLYTIGNEFLLGLMTNYHVVGLYAAVARLTFAATSLLTPIVQAVYPRMSKLVAEGKLGSAAVLTRSSFLILLALGSFLTMLLFLGAPVLVNLVFGSGYSASVAILRVLAFLPVVNAVSYTFGTQIMLPLGEDRAYALILLSAAFLNLAMALAATPLLGGKGMAIAYMTAEMFVSMAMLIYLTKRGITLRFLAVRPEAHKGRRDECEGIEGGGGGHHDWRRRILRLML